jgi:hypothetical protein
VIATHERDIASVVDRRIEVADGVLMASTRTMSTRVVRR